MAAPGDRAPALDLTDDTGVLHRWADHAGERVVLDVCPAAMTPGCTTQACDFRDPLGSLGVEATGVATIERATYNVRATGHVAALRRELGV